MSHDFWTSSSPQMLIASRDRKTGLTRFPPVRLQSPLAESTDRLTLTGSGTLYSFTVIHPNPKLGEKPFALGYVDMPGNVRIMGRIRGDSLSIGMACRPVHDNEYGYSFEAAEAR